MSWFSDIVEGASSLVKPLEFAYDVFNSERNYNYQREQYNYNKELQQQIFDREDNAVQRRMKDLKAAGMNPLLAAGGAAGTGQAVTVSAPQVPGLKSSYADYIIAKSKADADISMTKAQQELLNEQAEGVRLNNELTRKEVNWYNDHPQFSPHVESNFTSSRGLTQLGEAAFRRGGFLDRNFNSFKSWYKGMNDKAKNASKFSSSKNNRKG